MNNFFPTSGPASKPIHTRIQRCRACGNSHLSEILDLGLQALTGRFPGPADSDPPIAPLQLLICDTTATPNACGLVQLAHSCEATEMYGVSYGYRSSITRTMVTHLHKTAQAILDLAKPQNGDGILEVGSNDGTLQKYLAGRGFELVAIDPSAAKFAHEYPDETRLIVDFFSKAAIESSGYTRKFRAIISIAMFYDLEEPLAFMKSVRELLEREGVWCSEQAYMPAMLDSLCYDTICHEHLTYLGVRQFEWMAQRAGLKLIDVRMNDINGGSFTIFACRDDSALAQSPSPTVARLLKSEQRRALQSPATWVHFRRRVHQHRARVRNFFEDVRAEGKSILGLGASTKGNVILQYAGITPELMTAIAERDPRKVGLRTPRTGIPIITEDEARRLNPDYLFVGPWHFRDEIVRRESEYLAGGGGMVFPLPRFEVVRQQDGPAPSGIAWARPKLFGDERLAVSEALDSTMISGGRFVDEFEGRFAAMHHAARAAISTSNGTTALELAYRALGIKPGDEVIVPGFGFMAAANTAFAVGAQPVFADVDPLSWTIDPSDVMRRMSARTKAIVAIHTYGNVCDMKRLRDIAGAHGVYLIEDCAESLGSTLKGQWSGTFGDVSTFSFQATKVLTCGEGGAIICASGDVDRQARLIRNHGMEGRKRYWHHTVGHNFRLTNLQCAMLCAQLGHWDDIVAAHRRLQKGYRERLSGLKGIRFQSISTEVDPVMWAFGVELERADEALRDEVLNRMHDQHIECRPGFYAPKAQPIYRAKDLTVSDRLATQIIVPPIDTGMTEDSLDQVCDALITSLKGAGYG